MVTEANVIMYLDMIHEKVIELKCVNQFVEMQREQRGLSVPTLQDGGSSPRPEKEEKKKKERVPDMMAVVKEKQERTRYRGLTPFAPPPFLGILDRNLCRFFCYWAKRLAKYVVK